MLTPQTLQKLPDDLIDLVSEVQTDIIKSIAKKLVKAADIKAVHRCL